MDANARAIIAHPYEGALYWFLGEGRRHSRDNSYYQSLYGPDPEAFGVRAAALSCLFDEIVLGSADHPLPDWEKYRVGPGYFHPDLRVLASFDDQEWTAEGEELAGKAWEGQLLEDIFRGVPHLAGDRGAQRHFVCRLLQQTRMAVKYEATLVGDHIFQAAYLKLAPMLEPLVSERPSSRLRDTVLAVGSSTLSVVGLDFRPGNLDAFAAIRNSADISAYAKNFRAAITLASTNADRERALLLAMREAMEFEKVARVAQGALETTGTVASVVGFIPILGSVASAVGVAADAGERAAEKYADGRSWYLIGSRMQEIALKDALARLEKAV